MFATVAENRVLAHGDVSAEIDRVTERIAATPGDAKLRLRRAELHSTHRDWVAAEADFRAAARLDGGLAAVDLAYGEMLCQSGDFQRAIQVLDRFVAHEPRNASGRIARGRALVAAGRPTPAAADFAAAMELRQDADPGLYFEHARALDEGGNADDAVKSLDSGIARMGLLATLAVPAIDIEVRLGRFEAALKRLDRLATTQPRKERWFTRRGEILELAGRAVEARAAYSAARAAIASLPEERRGVAMIAALQRQVEAGISRLSGDAKAEGAK